MHYSHSGFRLTPAVPAVLCSSISAGAVNPHRFISDIQCLRFHPDHDDVRSEDISIPGQTGLLSSYSDFRIHNTSVKMEKLVDSDVFFPAASALYVSIVTNMLQPLSPTDLPKFRLFALVNIVRESGCVSSERIWEERIRSTLLFV